MHELIALTRREYSCGYGDTLVRDNERAFRYRAI